MFSHYEGCPRCIERGQDSRRDNLGVYRDGSAHCFACGHHRPGSVYKRWASSTASTDGGVNVPKSLLPFDWTKDVPADAWKWAVQYLPWSYWKESVGYSPSSERLVFQVGGLDKDEQGNLRRTGPMAFSIGRYVGPPVADKKHRKWHVWGDSHKHCELVQPAGEGDTSRVVLVEDVVSAHKVAHAGFLAVPLFGTVVHPCHLYYLLNSAATPILWLDKDQEWASKTKALRLGSILGKDVPVIITNDDPKSLAIDVIKKTVEAQA